MEYLEHFKLGSEPFSNAPMSRFYYGSHQHSEALRRLQYVASSMKGLAICVGDIGHGKTTLARRMLDSLPESRYEAAMLVIVHAGITANWLLKRIASQLGVEDPAEDKLAILSQLYNRLLEIHSQGKRAVVLIDEAQMLGTRELMEEFRGLLNLEVPEHKLITFIFFGLPELENNLRLDPPLAQRIALRYHLRPLTVADTTAYIQHRLRVAGASGPLFPASLMPEIHRLTNGVPRLINTLCDNLLLEMFFSRRGTADSDMLAEVGNNLGLPEDANAPPPTLPPPVDDRPAVEGSEGFDAIAVVDREALAEAVAASRTALAEAGFTDPAEIAAQVAGEPMSMDESATVPPSALDAEHTPSIPEPPVLPVIRKSDEVPAYDGPMEPVAPAEEVRSPHAPPDISDPLSYLSSAPATIDEIEPSAPVEERSLDYLDIEVVEEGNALGLEAPAPLPEYGTEAPFSPPTPQPVASTQPPDLALPLDPPSAEEEVDELPTFEAASSLEPSPSTRGAMRTAEFEVSADEVEIEEEGTSPDTAMDAELELEAEVEAELDVEADPELETELEVEAESELDSVPTVPYLPQPFETEVTQEYRPSDFQMGQGLTEDIEVTQIQPEQSEPEPEPEPAPAPAPEAVAEVGPRTITTSTGSTIDLNEIDNLLADINSSIGRK